MRTTARGVCAVLLSTSSLWAAARADEIVVTATKRAQRIEDIPGSVDVLTGAAAGKANNYDSAEEIAQRLAGVQAAVANGNQIAFQIRGVGAVDHQALTPTAAAVYMDGVFLATNAQTGPLLYDVERIEVLKGPQGALYGRNASSGAVNFLSARPTGEPSGYFGWSYGRFGRVDAKGAISGPLAPNIAGRVAGRYLSQGPTLDNVQTDPGYAAGPARAGGERDEFGVKGALEWRGEGAAALLRLHYEEDNGVNPAPRNLSLDLDKHEISVGSDGVQHTDNEFYGASLEIVAPAAGWRLISLSAVEGYGQDYGFDFDGSPAPFSDPTLNANLHYDRAFLQWSEELRLSRDWALGHSMIGFSAAAEDFEQEYLIWCGVLDPAPLLGDCRYVGAPGRVGPHPASSGIATTLVTDIEQRRRTAALFTRNDIEVTARLTLTLGARYTYEDIKGEGSGRHIFDDGVIAFNNRDGLGAATGANRIEENRLSGDAALSWRIDERAMVYALFSNGYKSGGFNGEIQNNAAHFADEGLFAAETVNAVELGYKGDPSASLSLSAAFFYQFYDAPQARIFVRFPLPDGTAITSNSLSNLDAARVWGLEARADWRPAPGLDIGASLALLESEIRQTTDVGGNAALFDANPLPFAPEASASLFGRFEQPLGGGASLVLTSNAKFQSAFYLDAEGLAERRQGAYTLVDGEAAIRFGGSGFEAGVWARNILDKEYAVSGFGFIGYNVFLGSPRTYGVSLMKRF